MKTIIAVIICVSVLVSVNCIAANDITQGQIIGNLDNKFRMLLGDKAVTNLGKKSGVIKGDILTIYVPNDTRMIDPIGRCAVIEAYDTTSICEIIRMKKEIGSDMVVIDRLKFNDPNFFPAVLELMSKVVEPYPPEKEVTVYIHNIYDENHNITKFSSMVHSELLRVFSQKKRIKLAGKEIAPELMAYYPGEYNEHTAVIEDYLRKDRIDAIISGIYRIKGDIIEISFYKIDKNWEDIAVDTAVAAAPYAELIGIVTVPFKQIRKEQAVNCQVIYRPVFHKTISRDERNDIIDLETKDNPILEYTLRRAEFNIIGPHDFVLQIDRNEIRFDKHGEYMLPLTTGRHEISASFTKALYDNDTFMMTLAEPANVVTKNAVLVIDNPEDIVIEIEANPHPRRENIVFKIYRKVTRKTSVVRPVLQKETLKPIETYKD